MLSRCISRCLSLSLAMVFLTVCPVLAHDMWIEPRAFQSDIDAVVGVQLRIGDRPAEAKTVVRDPQRIIRFVTVDSQGEAPLIGRAGMDPAGFLLPKQGGLRVLGYHSKPSFIELEAKKFESYLAQEGLEKISALRAKRGEQEKNGKESYARCLKALLSVGPPTEQDSDQVLGFPLEFIAGANPYQQTAQTPLPIRLLFEGQPLEGALVEAKSLNGTETVLTARTNANGYVSFRFPSSGAWMLNAVHMVKAKPKQDNPQADWESFWASLSFALPES